MEQINCITTRKKHKHILRDDRYVIEQMLNAGQDKAAIVAVIGCSPKTLKREIARGSWQRLNNKTYEFEVVYSWDVAQRRHDESGKNKGRYAKINDAPELRAFLELHIKKHGYSPEAALMKAQNESIKGSFEISVKTLYNNIDQGQLGVTRKDLLRKEGWKQDKTKPRKALNNLKGESIDNRPQKANDRSEHGHWEMDLIIGKKGSQAVLLTLTERKTREQIITKLPNKTQKAVNTALNYLERKHGKDFKEKFKTITTDNGSEFLNFELLEKSCLFSKANKANKANKTNQSQKRFKMYYAHPYSCWQRGSNENANGIVRRFLPKGTDFGKVTAEKSKPYKTG